MKAQFGRYVFVKKLAVGGMAEIFLARRLSFGGFAKFVVIKRLLPEHKGRPAYEKLFLTEARIGAALNHPNIVSLYDLGKLDDMYFMAMEYVDGLNVAELMTRAARQRKPIPTGVALAIIASVAEALEHSHYTPGLDGSKMGVVHNDISPQNVELSFEGDIKLLDFGVATVVGKKAPGGRRGKFGYMAPEAILRAPIDHRSDLYSLGVVLYEMTCGRRLFKGHDADKATDRAQHNRVPEPSRIRPDLPEGLEPIILRMLENDPEARYQRGKQVSEALHAAGQALGCDMSQEAVAAFLHTLLPEVIRNRRTELAALAEATEKRRSSKHRAPEPAEAPAPDVEPPELEEIPEVSLDPEAQEALDAANQEAAVLEEEPPAPPPSGVSSQPLMDLTPAPTPPGVKLSSAMEQPITASGEYQIQSTGTFDVPVEAAKPEEDAWDANAQRTPPLASNRWVAATGVFALTTLVLAALLVTRL